MTFLKFYYENILHRSLVRKEKEVKEHFCAIEKVLELALEINKSDERINENDLQTPQQKIAYQLSQA